MYLKTLYSVQISQIVYVITTVWALIYGTNLNSFKIKQKQHLGYFVSAPDEGWRWCLINSVSYCVIQIRETVMLQTHTKNE